MLAKLNKPDVVENLTASLSLDSQKDVKVICWGWIAFSGKEKFIPVVAERGLQW